MKYNILVLHNLGDVDTSLKSMVDYLKCFERYGPDHNYIYYKWTDPVVPSLREMDIHVVILDSSALGVCRYRPRELYYEIKEAWSFIADLDAVKIAFPQDDYHQSNVLDELFDDWGIDIVYSVLPKHMAMLYPRSGKKAALKGVLTGYVDDNSLDFGASFSKPFSRRSFDAGQRVSMYSPNGGRYAQMKGKMAENFKELATVRKFSCNISHRQKDTIHGDRWFDFLGDCRFVLGGEGGVSLWDPDGIIVDKVNHFIVQYPSATFDDVEKECFPGLDGQYVFSAISPRLFEAAAMGCCQILTEGEYLNLLTPFEHYIPVQHDLSDLGDAVDEMRNLDRAQKMISATYEMLIMNPDLRYSRLVREVMNDIDGLAAKKMLLSADDMKFKTLNEAIHDELRDYVASGMHPYGSGVHGHLANAVWYVAGKVPKRIRKMAPDRLLKFLKELV